MTSQPAAALFRHFRRGACRHLRTRVRCRGNEEAREEARDALYPGWIVKRLLPGIRTPLSTARGRARVGVRNVWVRGAPRVSVTRSGGTLSLALSRWNKTGNCSTSQLPLFLPSPSKGPKDLPSSQQRAAVWLKRTQPFLNRVGGRGIPFPSSCGSDRGTGENDHCLCCRCAW